MNSSRNLTPIKRSTAIKLILLGTGGAALAASLAPSNRNCVNQIGEPVACSSSRSSTSSSSSRSGYGWATSRQSRSTTVSRGGFGSSAVSSSG